MSSGLDILEGVWDGRTMTSPLDSLRGARESAEAARAAVNDAVLAAHAAGERVAAIAEAAGVSRQRVYQIVAAAKTVPADRDVLVARLEELDEAWECLVDKLAPRPADRRYVAGYAAVTRFQNTANGKSAKRGRGKIYKDVKPLIRDLAEAELLLVLEHRGDELVVAALGDLDVEATVRDLDEAAALRKQIAAFGDSGGFFDGI